MKLNRVSAMNRGGVGGGLGLRLRAVVSAGAVVGEGRREERGGEGAAVQGGCWEWAFWCLLGGVGSTGVLLLVQVCAGLVGSRPWLLEEHLVHGTRLGPKQCCGIAECLFVMGQWFGGGFRVLLVGEGWEGRKWVVGEEEEHEGQRSCRVGECVL